VNELPLSDMTVLDFSQVAAGPSASMYLADFGAEVIKVEPPGGDTSRNWGRYRFGEDDEFSALYASINRNKRSVVLDLKENGGVEVALRLAAMADVVLESFVPGVAERLGIGYESVKLVRPNVIYCSVSGFGQDGPMAHERGFDQLLQAYGGPTSITGHPDQDSVRFGPSAIDALTGAHAALGIMVAVYERRKSGRGQLVDTSLYDATLQMMSPLIAESTGLGVVPTKMGGRYSAVAPYGIFRASDREFFLAVQSDEPWKRLCSELQLGALLADPRFESNTRRVEHSTELYELLNPVFASMTAAEWVALAKRLKLPASVVNDIAEVAQHEQAAARKMLIQVAPNGSMSAGVPIKLELSPGTIRSSSPSFGSSTVEVLRRAGFDQTEIDDLVTNKVVAVSPNCRKS
jgi:crotonobetainyl-CoA:carnitine CoA-transferase CaiB-like acyl-CoA transferase